MSENGLGSIGDNVNFDNLQLNTDETETTYDNENDLYPTTTITSSDGTKGVTGQIIKNEDMPVADDGAEFPEIVFSDEQLEHPGGDVDFNENIMEHAAHIDGLVITAVQGDTPSNVVKKFSGENQNTTVKAEDLDKLFSAEAIEQSKNTQDPCYQAELSAKHLIKTKTNEENNMAEISNTNEENTRYTGKIAVLFDKETRRLTASTENVSAVVLSTEELAHIVENGGFLDSLNVELRYVNIDTGELVSDLDGNCIKLSEFEYSLVQKYLEEKFPNTTTYKLTIKLESVQQYFLSK